MKPVTDITLTRGKHPMTPDLSVVIISRNEEGTIEQCIESVLRETRQPAEVILVDSASTDTTLAIARRFPITVVQLESGSLLSPSAGRYIGTGYCSGEFIFYIDGDMVVCPGWLDQALETFSSPDLGGIAGRLYWVFPGEELHTHSPDHLPVGSLEALGGAAIYRRSILEKSGTFNPFLLGEEERELGYRIRREEAELLRIDSQMAYHLAKPRTQSEIDEKAKYFTGVGQILRAYGAQRISWDVIREQRVEFAWFGGVILLLLLIPLLASLRNYEALLWLLCLLSAGIGLLVGVKGWKTVFLYFRGIFFSGRNVIRGFRRGLPPATEYTNHSTHTVIQRASPHSAEDHG